MYGIGLVVFETGVEARFVLFDQRVFEQKGFPLGLSDDVVEVVDLPD